MKKLIFFLFALMGIFCVNAKTTGYQLSIDNQQTWLALYDTIPKSDYTCTAHHDSIPLNLGQIGCGKVRYIDFAYYPADTAIAVARAAQDSVSVMAAIEQYKLDSIYIKNNETIISFYVNNIELYTNEYKGYFSNDIVALAKKVKVSIEYLVSGALENAIFIYNPALNRAALYAPCYDDEKFWTDVNDIEVPQWTEPTAKKFIFEGRLYIEQNGHIYNSMGQRLK